MPYSCWMMAMSLWFNSSEQSATDFGLPFSSSPTTRASGDDDPSATRMTLTPASLADRPSARAALNVASPQTVGGYVPRIPNAGGREISCCTRGIGEKEGAFKVIPSIGCHRRNWHEHMLGVISDRSLNHPGLAGFPTIFTLHHVTPRQHQDNLETQAEVR